MATETLTVRQIAPDDIAVGNYVAITHEYFQYIDRFASECAHQMTMQRVAMVYDDDEAGMPLLVMRVCLPFVLVRKPDKQYTMVDIRRFKIVKLDDSYALDAIRFLKSSRKKASHDD